MRLAFKMLKIVGLLVGVLVVALAALLFITFSGAARPHPRRAARGRCRSGQGQHRLGLHSRYR